MPTYQTKVERLGIMSGLQQPMGFCFDFFQYLIDFGGFGLCEGLQIESNVDILCFQEFLALQNIYLVLRFCLFLVNSEFSDSLKLPFYLLFRYRYYKLSLCQNYYSSLNLTIKTHQVIVFNQSYRSVCYDRHLENQMAQHLLAKGPTLPCFIRFRSF